MPDLEDHADDDRSSPARPPSRGQLLGLRHKDDKNALTGHGTHRTMQESADDESDGESLHQTKRIRRDERDEQAERAERDERAESSLFFNREEPQQTPNIPQQRSKLAASIPNPNLGNLTDRESFMNSLIMSTGFTPQAGGTRKNMVELDPENHWIKDMRVIHKMSWGEIKDIMNAQRAREKKPQTYSEAAVYGRFVRNAPRIAEFKGEDFTVSDHMHIKPSERRAAVAASSNPQVAAQTSTTGTKWNDEKREQLIRCWEDANGELWQAVADKMELYFAESFDPAELEKLWGKFGKGGLMALSNISMDTT
ncbi:uncharacterized protein BDZ99DRAFT_457157 [Mytilinidion resinicola]|uniref:Uncharacterized protein n=1 Tax=Mytilinidion resinicola TaxID=574789 RepID=A0A6A6Z9E0_9PEZI|nr:uncharacterized protein BDZ99DRAFT_457157 [Mytilinidion resinicola]KAF2817418.1 hypothetical protein BDZ99DRAFT_457157 [Mytilinidion resinicola]